MEKAKIIIVSASSETKSEIAKDLEKEYEVHFEVKAGRGFTDLIEELRPEMVIIDTELQNDIDPVDAAKHLLTKLRIPVLFIIDDIDGEMYKRCREINPHGYLVKPFGKSELLTVVATAFGRHGRESILREMRKYYQRMIEHANEAVLVAQDGLIKFVNPAAVELFGFSTEDYDYLLQRHVETPFVEFIHPDDRNFVFERHLKRLKGDTFENVYVFRIIDLNGETKWLEINVSTFEWDGKQATLNFLKDVSDRVRAEEALRQRNLELELLNRVGDTLISNLNLNQLLIKILDEVRSIMNVVASSIWLLDTDTKELVCIESVGPGNELVRGWRLLPGEGIVGWVVQHRESLVVNDTGADERHFKGLDKLTGIKMFSILSVPLFIKKEIIGVLQAMDSEVDRFNESHVTLFEPIAASSAIAIENVRLFEEAKREIAERERAELKLRESEEIYRALFERNRTIIILVDPDSGQIVDANPAACDFYGYSRNRMKKMNIGEISVISQQQIQSELNRAKIGEKKFFIFKHRLKNGDIRDVEAQISDVIIGDRKFLYSIIHDITEKMNLEGEIVRSQIRNMSKKEMELIRYLSDGLGRKEISKKMNIAVATYDKHLMSIKRKIHVENRSDLLKFIFNIRDYLL